MIKIIFTFVFSFVLVANSYAQEVAENFFPMSKNFSEETLSKGKGALNTVTDVPESTIIEDKYAGKYQKATVENLSTLYWFKELLSYDNDEAIDNFILINECDFYIENINNDFKWARAREAARRMIKANMSLYSDKYQIVVPIDLGRYSVKKKGFPLIQNTKFSDLRRIEVGGNEHKVCNKKWNIKHYPRNVYLVLNEPFTYDFLEMDEHLAQAYILRNNINRPLVPKEVVKKKFNRIAFARVRMSFLEYQKTEKDRKKKTMAALMFGKIDGIDIFEHVDETGLLSSVDF